MTPRRSVGDRLFRWLLRLLPADFRGDFGDAMAADVEAAPRRGIAFWWREVRSLLAAAAREHSGGLGRDLGYALRTMRRTPGFTAMAVLMFALGTGVNVAMFSIVDAVMLRSPFERPAELVSVLVVENNRATAAVAPERFRDLAAAPPGPLAAVAALTNGMHSLTRPGDPLSVDDIECVSWQMFDVLGTPPLLGRTFGPGDDQIGAAPVIVLSHQFWHQLGGSTAILGTPLAINRTPVTVVGVMPEGFAGPLARADVQGWLPYSRPIKSAENSGCRQGLVNVVGRLRAGLSLGATASALPGVRLTPLESPILEDVRTPFLVLMAAVGCVLLIACFNVGGLQMERTLARRREMAVRLALGATWGRLVRQMLTENLLLAVLGGLAGLAAAAFTLQTVVSLLPTNVPYLDQVQLNARVLAATLLVAAAAGLVAGLLPLAEVRRCAPARDLTEAARVTRAGQGWGRRALVVAEIAISLVVLIGAALMVQTFLTLRPTRPGFDPARKVVMNVRLRGSTPEASDQFFSRLFERLRADPAIRNVGAGTYFPMSGNVTMAAVTAGEETSNLFVNYVTPSFLPMLRVPVIAGRMFSEADRRESLPVIIVNRMLAARIRPDGQVIGERLSVRSQSGPAASAPVEHTIVGVIGDMRFSGVDTRPRTEAYVPYAQNPVGGLSVVGEAVPGREHEAATALRASVRALAPDLVVEPPRPMEILIRRRMGATPFGTFALVAIAITALGLSAIGLMATIGWWVRQRTRELGVRLALGANRGDVRRMVLGQGLLLAGLGIGAGCGLAAGLSRYLENWVYGIAPLDPPTFVACGLLMLVIAAGAVYVPVRRATSIDPLVALRRE